MTSFPLLSNQRDSAGPGAHQAFSKGLTKNSPGFAGYSCQSSKQPPARAIGDGRKKRGQIYSVKLME